ncbi:MAG: DUF2249 domain-containing protein [Trueperaceae bacterium]|nr:DUF2249 domain-containing protein [Trueperaceae bacterium]
MLRPDHIYIDMQSCVLCGVCEDLLPGALTHLERIEVTSAALDAMAACPTGAIRWSEGSSMQQQQLDVRTIIPRERHPLIFQTFDALGVGASFELINDHDPKPLYYQLQAERPGQLDWEYLEQGPEVWRVRVGRAA